MDTFGKRTLLLVVIGIYLVARLSHFPPLAPLTLCCCLLELFGDANAKERDRLERQLKSGQIKGYIKTNFVRPITLLPKLNVTMGTSDAKAARGGTPSDKALASGIDPSLAATASTTSTSTSATSTSTLPPGKSGPPKVPISQAKLKEYKDNENKLNAANLEIARLTNAVADERDKKDEAQKEVKDLEDKLIDLSGQLADSAKKIKELEDEVNGLPPSDDKTQEALDKKDQEIERLKEVIQTLEEALVLASLSKKERIDGLCKDMRARVKDVVYQLLTRNWVFIENIGESQHAAALVYKWLDPIDQAEFEESTFVAQYMICVEDWLNIWRQKVQDDGKKAANGT